jgi:hypothetical protein
MVGVLDIFVSMVNRSKGVHLLERPIPSYLAQSFNHPYVVAVKGLILRSSPGFEYTQALPYLPGCMWHALRDDAKTVVGAGAFPGLCRLAHRDSYDTKYESSSPKMFLLSSHWNHLVTRDRNTCSMKICRWP